MQAISQNVLPNFANLLILHKLNIAFLVKLTTLFEPFFFFFFFPKGVGENRLI